MPMRPVSLLFALGATALLGACANGGIFHTGPDEFSVQREAPLAIPPDFALVPPQQGAPQSVDRSTQDEMQGAMFGGPAPRSDVEKGALSRAGAASVSIRSTVGDPATHTADKGEVTRDILSAPQGDGREAQVSVGS